jgi:hypothetical protein
MNVGNQAAGELGSRLAMARSRLHIRAARFVSRRPISRTIRPMQWNLDQGLQGIQRTAAAQGGPRLRRRYERCGAFASGLAANTYQQQYGNALAAYQMAYQQFNDTNANTFGRLMGVAGLGQAAASNTAAAGNAAAGTAAGISGSMGNSLAGLYTGKGTRPAPQLWQV